jgi:hypothetical protein
MRAPPSTYLFIDFSRGKEALCLSRCIVAVLSTIPKMVRMQSSGGLGASVI